MGAQRGGGVLGGARVVLPGGDLGGQPGQGQPGERRLLAAGGGVAAGGGDRHRAGQRFDGRRRRGVVVVVVGRVVGGVGGERRVERVDVVEVEGRVWVHRVGPFM